MCERVRNVVAVHVVPVHVVCACGAAAGVVVWWFIHSGGVVVSVVQCSAAVCGWRCSTHSQPTWLCCAYRDGPGSLHST